MCYVKWLILRLKISQLWFHVKYKWQNISQILTLSTSFFVSIKITWQCAIHNFIVSLSISLFIIILIFCSVKPFCQSPFGLGDGKMGSLQPSAAAAATPAWQGRAIATHRFRLLEFSAFVEQREEQNYQKHLFVHIASPVSYRYVILFLFCFHKKKINGTFFFAVTPC